MSLSRSIVFLGISLSLSIAAQAGVVAQATSENKARILLYSEPGKFCVGNALRTVFVSPQGARIEGCWLAAQGGNLRLVFADGDVLFLPMDVFKKPEGI